METEAERQRDAETETRGYRGRETKAERQRDVETE